MTPRQHLDDALIIAHVTGGLPLPMDVATATHLSLCPTCLLTAHCLDAVGGVMLEDLDGAPLPAGAWDSVLARLEEPEPEQASPLAIDDPETLRLLPPPLIRFVGTDLDALEWAPSKPGVSLAGLAADERQGVKAVLAGSHFSHHVHDRLALALVLAGGITDQNGHYRRGDMLVTEPGDAHRTAMDLDEDCLCFGVTDRGSEWTRLMAQ